MFADSESTNSQIFMFVLLKEITILNEDNSEAKLVLIFLSLAAYADFFSFVQCITANLV